MDGDSVVLHVLEEVLLGIKMRCSDCERTLKDEELLALNNLCGQTLVQALDLVDRSSIKLLSSPSGRKAYEVVGLSKSTYLCLTSLKYCSCLSFQYTVLTKGESLMCKHLLSVRVADALGSVVHQTVSDEDISEMLKLAASTYITELL